MGSRSGQLPTEDDLIDIKSVIDDFYKKQPNTDTAEQKVIFGTSGHRGASYNASFNEAHIVAITAALVEYRKDKGLGGPIIIGLDTHLLSLPAFRTTLRVLAAADVEYVIDSHITGDLLDLAEQGKAPIGCSIWTPTPAISHAILKYNKGKTNITEMADGVILTPSHNPPTDGGYKYNAEHGGAADSDATNMIAARANKLLATWQNIPMADFAEALNRAKRIDYRTDYIADLKNIIDLDAISESGVKICTNSLGGASVDYWSQIAKDYNLNLTVENRQVDPTFRFMTLDHDDKIRMDCSSQASMAGTVAEANSSEFDLVSGNDADSDRHGIIVRNPKTDKYELMNPNFYLAVCINYLFGGARLEWPTGVGVGKTLVSSSLIDKVVADLEKNLVEVPVGFKWFVNGLSDGSLGFGGEESAGASFLRKDGTVWTTDKDGIILVLLAAEIIAKTGKNPIEIYNDLAEKYGISWYARVDAPASLEEKAKLSSLSPEQVASTELAGEAIISKLTNAPGNGAKIGGLKVITKNAWFAARPSGTENVYKIYAESFVSPEHLAEVQSAAKDVVADALAK